MCVVLRPERFDPFLERPVIRDPEWRQRRDDPFPALIERVIASSVSEQARAPRCVTQNRNVDGGIRDDRRIRRRRGVLRRVIRDDVTSPPVLDGRRLSELQHTGHELPQHVVHERPVAGCGDDVRRYPQNPASASDPEDMGKGGREVVGSPVIRHPSRQEHPPCTEHVPRVVAIVIQIRQNQPQKRDRKLWSAGRNQARDAPVLHIAVHRVVGRPRGCPGSLPDSLKIGGSSPVALMAFARPEVYATSTTRRRAAGSPERAISQSSSVVATTVSLRARDSTA